MCAWWPALFGALLLEPLALGGCVESLRAGLVECLGLGRLQLLRRKLLRHCFLRSNREQIPSTNQNCGGAKGP